MDSPRCCSSCTWSRVSWLVSLHEAVAQMIFDDAKSNGMLMMKSPTDNIPTIIHTTRARTSQPPCKFVFSALSGGMLSLCCIEADCLFTHILLHPCRAWSLLSAVLAAQPY